MQVKDRKGFSASIGGASGAAPVNSRSLVEADSKFDRTRAQPNKGAASVVGAYGRVPVPNKDPKVASKEPSKKASWAPIKQPT